MNWFKAQWKKLDSWMDKQTDRTQDHIYGVIVILMILVALPFLFKGIKLYAKFFMWILG